MPGPYPDEFRQRALRMLSEARPDHKTDHAAIKHVAGRLGVNPETLRLWKRRLDAENASRISPATGDREVVGDDPFQRPPHPGTRDLRPRLRGSAAPRLRGSAALLVSCRQIRPHPVHR